MSFSLGLWFAVVWLTMPDYSRINVPSSVFFDFKMVGAGETAQWMQHLLLKCRGWSLNPRTHLTAEQVWHGSETGDPWARSAGIGKLWVQQEILRGEGGYPKSTSCLIYMHVHMYTCGLNTSKHEYTYAPPFLQTHTQYWSLPSYIELFSLTCFSAFPSVMSPVSPATPCSLFFYCSAEKS